MFIAQRKWQASFTKPAGATHSSKDVFGIYRNAHRNHSTEIIKRECCIYHNVRAQRLKKHTFQTSEFGDLSLWCNMLSSSWRNVGVVDVELGAQLKTEKGKLMAAMQEQRLAQTAPSNERFVTLTSPKIMFICPGEQLCDSRCAIPGNVNIYI